MTRVDQHSEIVRIHTTTLVDSEWAMNIYTCAQLTRACSMHDAPPKSVRPQVSTICALLLRNGRPIEPPQESVGTVEHNVRAVLHNGLGQWVHNNGGDFVLHGVWRNLLQDDSRMHVADSLVA